MLRTEEIGDSYIMNYRYDPNGTLVAVSISNLTDGSSSILFAQTNTRGDVVSLYNSSGVVKVNYVYDSWGKLLSATDGNGNALAGNSVGALNSIRYSGYVYDSETGFYYLQSRYYDPETGRFLNADDTDYIGASGSVLSYNAFAYCENNSVNDSDPSGCLAQSIIGAAMSGLIAYLMYYLEYYLGMRRWNTWTLISLVAVNAAIGAFTWYWGLGGKLQKLARLGGVLQNLKMVNKGIIKLFKIIKWTSKGVKAVSNMVIKKFTRYSGESWFTAIKRLIVRATGVTL